MAADVENPMGDFKPQKKEVEILKVIAEKVRGHVKWYSASKCYGFISRNDDGGDLFVHRSVISSYSKRFPSLRNGEEVEFSVVETNQGIEATYVTGPGGQPVKGMRPIYRRYRTTSDPNRGIDHQFGTNDQPIWHPRGSRRRGGGRMHIDGDTEPPKVEDETQGESKLGVANGGPQQVAVAADGESPNHVMPRQRRRPQRRAPRNRSAPTNGEQTIEGGVPVEVGTPEQKETNVPVRRFRRPFQPRGGGSRHMGNWYPPSYQGFSGGPSYGPRQYAMGVRNGFDHGFRRRNLAGGYSRGPRQRPRPVVDQDRMSQGTPAGQLPLGDEGHMSSCSVDEVSPVHPNSVTLSHYYRIISDDVMKEEPAAITETLVTDPLEDVTEGVHEVHIAESPDVSSANSNVVEAEEI